MYGPSKGDLIFIAVLLMIAGGSIALAAYFGVMWIYAHVVVVL
jgi:hypothetical protein